jgi:hypothetical protein
MNKRPDTGKKVDQTLDSLEGIQKAEPAPFFFTRVKARLERDTKNVWETAGSFLARPVIAFAGLCLILALNIFILIEKDNPSVVNVTTGVLPEDENILAVANTYDYENLEP